MRMNPERFSQRTPLKVHRRLEGSKMTSAELKLIDRALSARTVNALAEVATEPDRAAWIRLAFAVTLAGFQEIRLSPKIAALVQGLWVKAGYGPPQPSVPCDAYVADPCYRFLELWEAIARHLAKSGLAAQAEADLSSGMTVRACSGRGMASRLGRRSIQQWNVGPSCGRCGEPTKSRRIDR